MSCNNMCETCVGCGERPKMRLFSKFMTTDNKGRLSNVIDKLRESNRELQMLIEDINEPEMELLSSIYEAIEDEIATLDACIKS